MFSLSKNITNRLIKPALNAKTNLSQLHYAASNFQANLEKLIEKPAEIVKTNKKKLVVNPLKHEDFFQLNDLVQVEELFKYKFHFYLHLINSWPIKYLNFKSQVSLWA